MQTEETQELTECPNCCGDRRVIDDNHPDGAVACHYCDGKGVVTVEEAEEYNNYDPNIM